MVGESTTSTPRIAERARGRNALGLLYADLAGSVRNPGFWGFSSWLDIVASYRRSRLGVVWMLMPSILYVWGVGSFFAGIQGKPLFVFAAHVALGVTVFRLMATVITESTTILSSNQAFILDGHVRLTDFVLRVVAKAGFYFLIALPVVASALLVYPQLQASGLALLMLGLPLVVLNLIWIGVVMSLLGARFPDISQLTNSIFIFAFLLTPIIWYAEWAPAGTVRGELMRMNPLFHMVELIRAPILGESIDTATYVYIAVMTVVGWTVATFAYRRYARFVPLWV